MLCVDDMSVLANKHAHTRTHTPACTRSTHKRARTPACYLRAPHARTQSSSHFDADPTWDPLLSMDIPSLASSVSALVISPKLAARPSASSAAAAPLAQRGSCPSPGGGRAALSPSPTAGLSTLSTSSYDMGGGARGGGGGGARCAVVTRRLGDWLGGAVRMWDVLKGCPLAEPLLPADLPSVHNGGLGGSSGARGSGEFVVVKEPREVGGGHSKGGGGEQCLLMACHTQLSPGIGSEMIYGLEHVALRTWFKETNPLAGTSYNHTRHMHTLGHARSRQ